MTESKHKTPEAALGLPSDEHLNACGGLQVPYLSLSWKELKAVKVLTGLSDEDFEALMLKMLRRRLPDLTEDEFEEACGPSDFVPWVNAVQAGPGDSGNA